jgi:hypothetical protein
VILALRAATVSVAQPDRAADFGSAGWGFESLQARGAIGKTQHFVIFASGREAYGIPARRTSSSERLEAFPSVRLLRSSSRRRDKKQKLARHFFRHFMVGTARCAVRERI